VCVFLQGKQVSKASLLQNLVRNTNINLAGIGITLIGLQASGGCCAVGEGKSQVTAGVSSSWGAL
jgi:hypothetical protein